MVKKKRLRHWFSPYHFIVTFPDRVYPFSTQVHGKRVRWMRSYEYRIDAIQRKLGIGRLGIRLATYRVFFHIIGAVLLIASATIFSNYFFGSDVALPIVFVLAMLMITYQEFVLQPRTYHQHLGKGITDWISWGLPLLFYFLYVLH